MNYYAVVEIKLLNRDWLAAYIPAVTALAHKHGGRYLSRTAKVERLEGGREVPDVVVIIEFPSKAAAEAFYRDPAYQPYLTARLEGTESHLTLVAGEDMAAD